VQCSVTVVRKCAVYVHHAPCIAEIPRPNRENGSMASELAGAMFNNVDAGVPDEHRANKMDSAAALRHMRCGCRDAHVFLHGALVSRAVRPMQKVLPRQGDVRHPKAKTGANVCEVECRQIRLFLLLAEAPDEPQEGTLRGDGRFAPGNGGE
jgi:hypothetical protein